MRARMSPGVAMPYQYVREPLTAEEADRLANACESPTEQLIVWTLLFVVWQLLGLPWGV